jgi:hypothetical protein
MEHERSFRLRVEGWQYGRNGYIKGEKLLMEVARESCRHCPTCSRRVESVESRLRASGVAWGWETGPGNGLYVAVPAPKDVDQVGNYLTRLIGREVAVA